MASISQCWHEFSYATSTKDGRVTVTPRPPIDLVLVTPRPPIAVTPRPPKCRLIRGYATSTCVSVAEERVVRIERKLTGRASY